MDLDYFSNKLKSLRENKGMTLIELSKEAKVAKSAISDYENKNRTPKRETIEKLANALEVTSEELTKKPHPLKVEILKLFDEVYEQYKSKALKNNSIIFSVISDSSIFEVTVQLDEEIKETIFLIERHKERFSNRLFNSFRLVTDGVEMNGKEGYYMSSDKNNPTIDLISKETFQSRFTKWKPNIIHDLIMIFDDFVINGAVSPSASIVNLVRKVGDVNSELSVKANHFTQDEAEKVGIQSTIQVHDLDFFIDETITFIEKILNKAKEKGLIISYEIIENS